MLRLIILIFCIFFVNKIFCGIALNEQELTNNTDETSTSYWCNETYIQGINQQFKQISLEFENQRLSNELLTKKLDTIQNILEQKQISTSTSLTRNLHKKPASCAEALQKNNKTEGVFQIFMPEIDLEPFFVYCLKRPETNEPWMIIQRRMNGKIDFYQNWHEYKHGFGDIFEEYWLGLEKIYRLTNSRPYKLWIELQDFKNMNFSQNYALFAIGNETTKYRLNVLGESSGILGHSLRYYAGQKFSTYDNRNDGSSDNECARNRKGAWWFNICQESDLNGEYYPEGQNDNLNKGLGINWYSWHGNRYSLKYVHMAIAPIDVEFD